MTFGEARDSSLAASGETLVAYRKFLWEVLGLGVSQREDQGLGLSSSMTFWINSLASVRLFMMS